VEEENAELRQVRRLLLENPESKGATEVPGGGRAPPDPRRDQLGEGRGQGRSFQQAEQLSYLYEQIRRGKQAEKVDPDSPYFGHLRLRENGRSRDVFLGKATQLEHGLRIVDWRNAPISRLFYQYKEGDEYMEEMADTVREGTIDVRRTVHIARGELRRVGTPDGTWVHESGNGWTFTSTEMRKLAGGEGRRSSRAGSRTRASAAATSSAPTSISPTSRR
jgi:DNA helicase-2/ATP-dependent DNA helicase PcrA